MLSDYWKRRDLATGETWLEFTQRTGMDTLSIAYGQAFTDRMEARKKTGEIASRPWDEQSKSTLKIELKK